MTKSLIDATRSDNIDTSIRRFKRFNDKVGKSRRIHEIQFHVKRTTKRRLAAISARKRHLKNLFKERAMLSRAKQRALARKKR